MKKTEHFAYELCIHSNCQTIIQGKTFRANVRFSLVIIGIFIGIVFETWLTIILLCSGDVYPNPGPSSTSSSVSSINSSLNMSNSLLDSLSLNHNLSFFHYNVRSVFAKLDILHAELIDFDILAFTETRLSPLIDSEDLSLISFNKPERKNRIGDSHGGVILYVKTGIHYKRRADLEIRDIENIWIELINNHILFGMLFGLSSPNSDANYYTNIENSLALAVDTGLTDIVITGDLNLNLLNPQTSRKLFSLCTQFSLFQSITQPTHFTENSSSLIDVILVTNKENLIYSGVGEPFLNQELRYHCPVYSILKFSKQKHRTFTRHIWSYEHGNYNILREKASSFNWNTCHDNGIDVYANNLNAAITGLALECIPNRIIRIKPSDPLGLRRLLKGL